MLEVARNNTGFLGVRASFHLARTPTLGMSERLEHFERALGHRIEDPLARRENLELVLELAQLAESAGDIEKALEAYERSLPLADAREGLGRLHTDAYELSRSYFKARLYQDALDALGAMPAPSIEAPSYQALGQHKKALAAFERWLLAQPENIDALYGEAWAYFRLGNMEAAKRKFLDLAGSNALYGRALIANREGSVDKAVTLLMLSGRTAHAWLATGLLEARDRYLDALPIYLHLAERDTHYADDAAYRAMILARRLGLRDIAVRATSLVPNDSFFGLKLGNAPYAPTKSQLPSLRPAVIDLAAALANAGDVEAAVGELHLGLRAAEDEATAVAIGETLQVYGEYRQSQRRAAGFISRGSTDLRTWKLAYPQAYPELVLVEAERHALDPEIIWAVMRKESAFYPQAVSRSNARGLMQVIPSTWNWLAELRNETPGDPFDPAANIRYGSTYLAWLMKFFEGDLELVVASYNRGQGYIQRLFEGSVVQGKKDELYREIDTLETREYMQQVLVSVAVYRALYH
jgi:soluble lytic murein transglycosylase